jgi:hypothetical protein
LCRSIPRINAPLGERRCQGPDRISARKRLSSRTEFCAPPSSPAAMRRSSANAPQSAATRGRNATDGGDGHAGVKTGHPFERRLANARIERRDRGRHARRRPIARRGRARRVAARGHATLGLEIHGEWRSVSHPRSTAYVAANDASLIGERATARGRSPGGDRRAGAKRRCPFAHQPRVPYRQAGRGMLPDFPVVERSLPRVLAQAPYCSYHWRTRRARSVFQRLGLLSPSSSSK